MCMYYEVCVYTYLHVHVLCACCACVFMLCVCMYMYVCVVCMCVYVCLLCSWLPNVQTIFYQGNKKKLIPHKQLEAFFKAAAVLMTNQLRELALDSISDYLHVFCPSKVIVLS